jgi:hypothetical protein
MLRVMGYHPPVEGWSGWEAQCGSAFFGRSPSCHCTGSISECYTGKKWGYAGVLLLGNLFLTTLVLMAREGS